MIKESLGASILCASGYLLLLISRLSIVLIYLNMAYISCGYETLWTCT
jgi:hypothetical protein